MTDAIPGVMGFVVRKLKIDPDTSSRELYDLSRRRYPAVGDLTVRQFHARYPLQAKKQLNAPVIRRFPVPKPETPAPPGAEAAPREPGTLPGEPGTPPGEPATPPREALRLLLFRLALDMETARTRADLVDFVAGIDRYVDEAMAIGDGGRGVG